MYQKRTLTMQLSLQNLGCNVSRGTTLCGKSIAVSDRGESEVNDFNISVIFATDHQQILRLQVPVRDVIVMAVLNRTKQGVYELTGLHLGVKCLLHDAVKQLTSGDLF